MRLLTIVIFAFLLSIGAAFGDPEGEMTGTNPGSQTKYSGTVVVQRTADTLNEPAARE